MSSLLRLPGFGRLVGAYVLNELAWSVGTLALAVLVYRRTGSALGSAGFFLCSQAAPALLSPLLVGRLDRRPPRIVLPLLYGLEAVLFGVLAWLTHRFLLAPVLLIALADGVVALAARALAAGARAELLRPVGRLREGNALVGSLFSAVFLLGPLIGGGVVALGGTVDALLANCGLFALMAVTLVSPTVPDVAEQNDAEDGGSGGRMRAGLARVRTNRPVATLLALQSAGMVFFTISVPVEVVYASHTLHAGPGGYGLLMAAWGGGAVAGSAAFARWRVGARVLLAVFAAVAGAGFAVMAAAPEIVLGLVGAAIAGSANGAIASAFPHEIQERSPPAWTALITSLAQGTAQLALGLGIVLGGLLAALAGARVAFVVAAAGSLALGGLTFAALAPARLGEAEAPGDPDRAAAAEESPDRVGPSPSPAEAASR